MSKYYFIVGFVLLLITQSRCANSGPQWYEKEDNSKPAIEYQVVFQDSYLSKVSDYADQYPDKEIYPLCIKLIKNGIETDKCFTVEELQGFEVTPDKNL